MESKPSPNNSLKFLYSYGGRILFRSTDGILRYYGGHTRVLSVQPSIRFTEFMAKLAECCGSSSVAVKCPLPNGDLETLISITNDEDLANIIQLYDRASSSLKIRVILSPPNSLKKLSPSPSSSSSGATNSLSGSPYSSAGSPPYSAPHRFVCHNRSLVPIGYPIGVRNEAVKGCCNTWQFDGNPRSLYRGPRFNYYCH